MKVGQKMGHKNATKQHSHRKEEPFWFQRNELLLCARLPLSNKPVLKLVIACK